MSKPKFFYGWWIVFISFVVNAILQGVFHWSMAVFFLPISRDLGVSRAAAALPVSISRLTGVFQSPMFGTLTDRFGPSRVLFVCALIAGLGFILLSRTQTYNSYLLIFVGVIGLGMVSGFDAPTLAAVSKWFNKKRSIALSLTAAGFATGGTIITPLVALSVGTLGWRDTALLLGILIWLIVLPLATRLFSSPESQGLLPDGDEKEPSPSVIERSQAISQRKPDFNILEAFKTRGYWQLGCTLGIRAFVFNIMMIHMVAIMKWKGIDESTAGVLIGIFAFVGIPTALFMGWLGDRMPKHKLVSIGDAIASLALIQLAFVRIIPVWWMISIFILWSPNQGNWPLSWSILAERFGRENFGALRGYLVATMQLFSFTAPLFSGWIFDQTQSYQWALIPAVFLTFIASILSWTLPKPSLNTRF